MELLKLGLCWVFERYLAEASPDIEVSYQQAQATARQQRLGLWNDPFLVPPGIGERRKRTRQDRTRRGLRGESACFDTEASRLGVCTRCVRNLCSKISNGTLGLLRSTLKFQDALP
jgi:hypothetical protein